MGKFTLNKSTNSQYYFNLKADNGQVILTSEMYVSKQGCQNGINSVKTNSPYDSNYQRKISTNDKYYFTLHSPSNGQVIGVSEMYESSSGRDNGIESVKSNAPGAQTIDNT